MDEREKANSLTTIEVGMVKSELAFSRTSGYELDLLH